METRTESQKEEAFRFVIAMMERDHVGQTEIKGEVAV